MKPLELIVKDALFFEYKSRIYRVLGLVFMPSMGGYVYQIEIEETVFLTSYGSIHESLATGNSFLILGLEEWEM